MKYITEVSILQYIFLCSEMMGLEKHFLNLDTELTYLLTLLEY